MKHKPYHVPSKAVDWRGGSLRSSRPTALTHPVAPTRPGGLYKTIRPTHPLTSWVKNQGLGGEVCKTI